VAALLVALSLPPALVFVQHAFGDRVQGNWPAIMYPALAVAAAALPLSKRWWIGAATLGFAVTALAYLQAATSVIPLPPRLDPIAIRLAGWDSLAGQAQASLTATGAAYVAADDYAVASELAWWMPPGTVVVGQGQRWALTTLPPAPIAGKPGLLIRDAGRTDAPDPIAWPGAERVGTLTRPGAPAPDFALYRVTTPAEVPGTVVLPRRSAGPAAPSSTAADTAPPNATTGEPKPRLASPSVAAPRLGSGLRP
jgi:hypothetical protein